MRRAAKVDGNHRLVVAAFKALGCSVQSLAAVGKGVPDLLVGFAGLNHLVEVKDGRKVKSARKQTPLQVVWASTWRAPRHLVESVDDVQRLVKAWRFVPAYHVPPQSPVLAAPDFDADDYNGRPLKPGEWLPMPHKDSPTVKP